MSRAPLSLAAMLFACLAHAAPFADPTQPPAARDAGEGLMPGPRIESILIAPDRRLAVISGQQVTIGSRVGSAVVVGITETEVMLRGADGERTLKLFPELVRQSAAAGKKGRPR